MYKGCNLVIAKRCIAIGVILSVQFIMIYFCLCISCYAVSIKAKQYDVVSYGGDPSGNLDSTDAILAAINAAKAVGEGTIFFRPGKFLYNRTICIPPNIKLLGASAISSILQPTNSRSCTLMFFGNGSVSNMNIDPKHLASNSPIPLAADIYINGLPSPSSMTIANVNADVVECLACNLLISSPHNTKITRLYANACTSVKIIGGNIEHIDLDLIKQIPCQNVSIAGTTFLPTKGLMSKVGLTTKGVKSIIIENCYFNNNTVIIHGGSNCLIGHNSFETSSTPLICLITNNITGNALRQKSGLVIENNEFTLKQNRQAENRIIAASVTGSKFPTGILANGKILFENNKLDGAIASFGGEGYTNDCIVNNNRLFNGSTLRLTPGSWASGVLGSAITISNNTFSGCYDIKGNNKDWLISVVSAPFAKKQKRDPILDGVTITDNTCSIDPIENNMQLGFIWCCTSDPSTAVNIRGNMQSPGLLLPTVQGNNISSMLHDLSDR